MRVARRGLGSTSSAALSAATSVFVPCHQYAYSPLWSTVAAVIADGRIGRTTLAQFNVYRTHADAGSAAAGAGGRVDKSQSGGGILVESSVARLDGLLVSFVKLLGTLNNYRRYLNSTDLKALESEVARLGAGLTATR